MVRRRSSGSWYRLLFTRSAGLYIGGMAGIGYETLGTNLDRPYLIAAFCGMLGLPSFLGKDERNRDGSSHDDDEDDGDYL